MKWNFKIIYWRTGKDVYKGRVFNTIQEASDFLNEDQHTRHPNATDEEFNQIMGEFEVKRTKRPLS